MAARLFRPLPTTFPVLHGMLRATGDILRGSRRTDTFDVVLDGRGQVTALVLEERSADAAHRPLLDEAWRAARISLLARAPLQQVVAAVGVETLRIEHAEIGFAMVRVSQRDARVEVVNAGMPAIVCAAPGRTFFHPALSAPLGSPDVQRHTHEIVPLIWGSVWLLASSGLTSGSLEARTMRGLCERLELANRGMTLTAASPDQLRDQLLACHPSASGSASTDATILLLGADPHARLAQVR